MDSASVTSYIDWLNGVDSLWQKKFWQLHPDFSIPKMTDEVATVSDNTYKILSQIKQDGIGYSDAVSTIAIPLIIALFAFSFMFLFDAMNRINEKYNSSKILALFKNQKPFYLLIPISIISVSLVLLYGIATLFFQSTNLWASINKVVDLLIFLMALVYSIEVVCFTRTCIRFNKPTEVLKIIQDCIKISAGNIFVRTKYLFVNIFKRNPEYRKLKAQGERLINSFGRDALFKERVKMFFELYKYACFKRDGGFLNEVLKSLQEITDYENGYSFDSDRGHIIRDGYTHIYSNLFYDSVFEATNLKDLEPSMQDNILSHYLGRFNHLFFINEYDIKFVAKHLIKQIEKSDCYFLERYVSESSRVFSKVISLPQIAYVLGKNKNDIKDVSKKTNETWDIICTYHFVVLAYAFHYRYYSIIDQALLNRASLMHNIYPITLEDILYRYEYCMKNIEDHNMLNRLDVEKIFLKQVDIVSILNIYTSFLLLYVLNFDTNQKTTISLEQKYLDQLNDASNVIKNDPKVIEHYHGIEGCDLSFLYQEISKEPLTTKTCNGMSVINYCFERVINKINAWFWQPFHDEKLDGVEPNMKKKEVINKSEFLDELSVFFCSNYPGFENKETGLFRSKIDQTDEFVMIEPYSFILRENPNSNKSDFHQQTWGIYSRVNETVYQRVLYVYLAVIDEFKGKEIEVSIADLKDYVAKVAKQWGEDFTIIYVDKVMDTGEIKTVDIDSFRYSLLKGLPCYESLAGHLLIVRKSQLPYLENSIQDRKTILNIEKVSDDGKMMKLTVDYKLSLHYSKDIDIKFVKLKPIQVLYKS